LEKRSYASPSKVTPSVSKDIPLLSVGKSPSAKDHDNHFSMDIDYELPFVHLETGRILLSDDILMTFG
jgi:hypothetical protein